MTYKETINMPKSLHTKRLETYMKLIEHWAYEADEDLSKAKANKVIEDIYIIAHIANRGCEDSIHQVWVEKWDKVIKSLKKAGEIK